MEMEITLAVVADAAELSALREEPERRSAELPVSASAPDADADANFKIL